MPTSSFDRVFTITDPKSVEILEEVLRSDTPVPVSKHLYTAAERKKSEELLLQYLSRSAEQ